MTVELNELPREPPRDQGGGLTAALLVLCLFLGSVVFKMLMNSSDEHESREDRDWQQRYQAAVK